MRKIQLYKAKYTKLQANLFAVVCSDNFIKALLA